MQYRHEKANIKMQTFPSPLVCKNLCFIVAVFSILNTKLDGSTHPCVATTGGGGVARNMAEALWRLRGGRVSLLTAVADDADGRYLSELVPGLMLDGCKIRGARTPTYAAVMDAHGECRLGLGDMALHGHISIDLVNRHMDVLENAPVVVLDGNAPQATIQHVIHHCNRINKPGEVKQQ